LVREKARERERERERESEGEREREEGTMNVWRGYIFGGPEIALLDNNPNGS
jgi:hypothetical protein